MKRTILYFISLMMIKSLSAADGVPMKFTILYDNNPYNSAMEAQWGFSCLIEGCDKTILFDAGGKSTVFARNATVQQVDFKAIDAIVISHNHWDHVAGVDTVLAANDSVELYLPDDVRDKDIATLKTGPKNFFRVTNKTEICPGVFSAGCMDASKREQALLIESDSGLVMIVGCSHPGIVAMVRQARLVTGKDVYMVFGGLHLLRERKRYIQDIARQLKELGVVKLGATHCTGKKATGIFKQEFGENFIEMGVGKRFALEEI